MGYGQSSRFLFADERLADVLDAHMAQAGDKVNAIPKDQFLISSDDQITAHILSDLSVEPIEIHEHSKVMEQEEIQIEVNSSFHGGKIRVPAVRLTVSIPYTGDPALWRLRPSHGKSVSPEGEVRPRDHKGIGYIDIIVEQRTNVPLETIKREVDEAIDLVKSYLAGQRDDIQQRNQRLDGLIRQAIRARRERLEKQEGLAKLLDIPLKKREGAPTIEPIRVERRLVQQLPSPPVGGSKSEPGITEADYSDILTIIRHEGRTFETTPSTYAVHDEEDLRNIILAHLNGHYKGSATGETFRGRGKTDIRIEAEDRAAFVAECKVWRGAKELSAALDQLLGYLTWRDCKCAIVVFNKHNARFTQLLQEVPIVFRERPCFCKELEPQGDGEWRFVFKSKEDEGRQISVHIFLFNLYVADR